MTAVWRSTLIASNRSRIARSKGAIAPASELRRETAPLNNALLFASLPGGLRWGYHSHWNLWISKVVPLRDVPLPDARRSSSHWQAEPHSRKRRPARMRCSPCVVPRGDQYVLGRAALQFHNTSSAGRRFHQNPLASIALDSVKLVHFSVHFLKFKNKYCLISISYISNFSPLLGTICF